MFLHVNRRWPRHWLVINRVGCFCIDGRQRQRVTFGYMIDMEYMLSKGSKLVPG